MRLLPPTPVSRTASQLSYGCENPSTSARTARPGSPPTPSWIPFALTRAFKTCCAAWAFHSEVCNLVGVPRSCNSRVDYPPPAVARFACTVEILNCCQQALVLKKSPSWCLRGRQQQG